MSVYDMKKPKRINSVSVSMTLILLVVGYLAYAFGPTYWAIFRLQGVIKSACNEAYRQMDDDKVLDFLVSAVPRTGLPLSKDNFRFTRVPYTGERARELFDKPLRDVAISVTNRGMRCEIEYYYKHELTLPLLGIEVPLVHNGTVTGSLEPVQY